MIWPFSAARRGADLDPPAPDRTIWAVGDLHGCAERLDALVARIDAEGGAQDRIVFLGDYADRGSDSRGVLQRLRKLYDAPTRDAVFLMGNHDRMLLDFLADPLEAGPRFLGNGGQETLISFGIMPAAQGGVETRLQGQADALAAAMGDLRDWLALRPLWHRSGNCIFVHAQTDPRRPMEEQTEHTLLWARPSSRPVPRDDGHWVIHGHTILPEPRIAGGQIGIDTGAYRGTPLTAVRLAPDAEPRFVQV